MKKIFGIDLGTTYSCIAFVNEYGAPEVVPNKEGVPTTPSVVSIEEDGHCSVGEPAKNTLDTDPDTVCSTIKRQMGRTDYTFSAFGREYTPESISALILEKLVKDANEKLGDNVKDVVITCPAYFGDDERNATKKAGEIAGLHVIQLLNEPTAAAISYGIKTNEPQTVLVYDLGGGTFDVTILRVDNDQIRTIATGGDHKLGGKDWDKKIIDYIVTQVCQSTGDDPGDIYTDTELMGDLSLKAEKIKIDLTQKPNAKVKFNGETVVLSREQFDQMTSDLLESTIQMTHKVIDEAATKGLVKFDKILLVGGSTYMPQVENRVKQEFDNVLVEFCDPNQSVAKGAAIFAINQAAFAESSELTNDNGDNTPIFTKEEQEELKKNPIFRCAGDQVKPINIIDVTSSSIGARLLCDDGKTHIVNQVYKDTEIPCEYATTFGTVVENQTSMLLEIFENRSMDEYPDEALCKPLTSGSIGPLPSGLPINEPVNIIFKIDKQGMLYIDAEHKPSGVRKHMEVQFLNQISEEELARQKENFNALRRL